MKSSWITPISLAFLVFFSLDARASRVAENAHECLAVPEFSAVKTAPAPLTEPVAASSEQVSGEWLLRAEQLLNNPWTIEQEYRQRETEFLVGLDTKQFALGMRYLLNKRTSSSE